MEDWKKELNNYFKEKEKLEEKNKANEVQSKKDAGDFISSIVVPAFNELKKELEKNGREVNISSHKESAYISVKFSDVEEMDYGIGVRIHPHMAYPFTTTRTRAKTGEIYLSEGVIRSGAQDYTVSDISKEDIIQSFLTNYKMR
jgi:hypothetical protein